MADYPKMLYHYTEEGTKCGLREITALKITEKTVVLSSLPEGPEEYARSQGHPLDCKEPP